MCLNRHKRDPTRTKGWPTTTHRFRCKTFLQIWASSAAFPHVLTLCVGVLERQSMPRQLLNIITEGDTVPCDCVSKQCAPTEARVKRLRTPPVCGASATGKPWHEQPYRQQEAIENQNRRTLKMTQTELTIITTKFCNTKHGQKKDAISCCRKYVLHQTAAGLHKHILPLLHTHQSTLIMQFFYNMSDNIVHSNFLKRL